MYLQQDDVSMGSPLGVAFANFCMCNLENNIFQTQLDLKPIIYCSYIDNIFIVTPNIQQLQLLKMLTADITF